MTAFLKTKAASAAATPRAGAKLISIWPGPYSAFEVMTSTPAPCSESSSQVTNAMNGRYMNRNGYWRARRMYSSGSVASAVHAAIVEASSRAPCSHARTGRHMRRISLIEMTLSSATRPCEIATSSQKWRWLIGW